MKKLLHFTGIGVYMILAIGAFVSMGMKESAPVTRTVNVTEASFYSDTTSALEEYILKSSEGVIVVVEKETGQIVMKTDTQVSMLPKEDRKSLERGIHIRGKAQLRNMLEDFCS